MDEFEGAFNDLRGISNEKNNETRKKKASDSNHCVTRLKQTIEIGKKVRGRMEAHGFDTYE